MEIKLLEKGDFKGYTFVEGFPGVGLVGPMAISYMIDKLNMKYIGYFVSKHFPPMIAIHDGTPMPPVRVYKSDKNKIISIFAEFAIPFPLVNEFGDVIYQFIKDSGIKKIISISGIPSSHVESDDLFAITSKSTLTKEASSAGLKPVINGVATGVSAMLMKNCIIDDKKGIDMINLLVPVEPNIVDPKYAELAINSINKLMGLNIDVKELDKEAQAVEAKIRELMQKSKETKENYQKTAGNDSEESMYG